MNKFEKITNWCLGIYFVYLLIISEYSYEIKAIFCVIAFLYIVIKKNYAEQEKKIKILENKIQQLNDLN